MPYKHKEDNARRVRRYYQSNKTGMNKIQNNYKRRLRDKIITRYGGKCAQCGFTDYRALHLDHINNDGAEERKVLSNYQIMLKMLKEDLSGRYQILCANCNIIKERIRQGYTGT